MKKIYFRLITNPIRDKAYQAFQTLVLVISHMSREKIYKLGLSLYFDILCPVLLSHPNSAETCDNLYLSSCILCLTLSENMPSNLYNLEVCLYVSAPTNRIKNSPVYFFIFYTSEKRKEWTGRWIITHWVCVLEKP